MPSRGQFLAITQQHEDLHALGRVSIDPTNLQELTTPSRMSGNRQWPVPNFFWPLETPAILLTDMEVSLSQNTLAWQSPHLNPLKLPGPKYHLIGNNENEIDFPSLWTCRDPILAPHKIKIKPRSYHAKIRLNHPLRLPIRITSNFIWCPILRLHS